MERYGPELFGRGQTEVLLGQPTAVLCENLRVLLSQLIRQIGLNVDYLPQQQDL